MTIINQSGKCGNVRPEVLEEIGFSTFKCWKSNALGESGKLFFERLLLKMLHKSCSRHAPFVHIGNRFHERRTAIQALVACSQDDDGHLQPVSGEIPECLCFLTMHMKFREQPAALGASCWFLHGLDREPIFTVGLFGVDDVQVGKIQNVHGSFSMATKKEAHEKAELFSKWFPGNYYAVVKALDTELIKPYYCETLASPNLIPAAQIEALYFRGIGYSSDEFLTKGSDEK